MTESAPPTAPLSRRPRRRRPKGADPSHAQWSILVRLAVSGRVLASVSAGDSPARHHLPAFASDESAAPVSPVVFDALRSRGWLARIRPDPTPAAGTDAGVIVRHYRLSLRGRYVVSRLSPGRFPRNSNHSDNRVCTPAVVG